MYACRFVSYHMLSGERNQFLWFFVFVCVSVRLLLFLIASVHACRCHPCRLWFNCHRYLLHRCIDWCTCVCLFLAQRCCSTHVDYSFVVVVNQVSGNKCFAVVPRNTRSFERFKYLRTCFFCRRCSPEVVVWEIAKLPHSRGLFFCRCSSSFRE